MGIDNCLFTLAKDYNTLSFASVPLMEKSLIYTALSWLQDNRSQWTQWELTSDAMWLLGAFPGAS